MSSFLFDLHDQPRVSGCDSSHGIFKVESDHFGRIDLLQTFSSLLSPHQTTSSEDDLFQCLLLMARIHLAVLSQIIVDHNYVEPNELDLWQWYRCRDAVESFEDDLRAFSRFVRREFDKSVFQEQLEEIREDQEDFLAQAKTLETFLRDALQVSVGFKSLEESRRSIEEGKRTKLSKTPSILQHTLASSSLPHPHSHYFSLHLHPY